MGYVILSAQPDDTAEDAISTGSKPQIQCIYFSYFLLFSFPFSDKHSSDIVFSVFWVFFFVFCFFIFIYLYFFFNQPTYLVCMLIEKKK